MTVSLSLTVSVLPLTAARPLTTLKITGSPEQAVAESVTGEPTVTEPIGAKETVWPALAMSSVRALLPALPARSVAPSVTAKLPTAVGVPEIAPVPVLTVTPPGRPVAE